MEINKFAPTGKISANHLVSLASLSEDDVSEILSRAREFSVSLSVGEKINKLKDKYVCLISKNGFTRSRVAFETAVDKLSGKAIVCTVKGDELEKLVNDNLSVAAMANYGVNAFVVQTDEPADAELIEKKLDIPVVNANGVTGPCEALSALYTIWNKKGRLDGLKIAMICDPKKHAENFAKAFSLCASELRFICPAEMMPDKEFMSGLSANDVSVYFDVTEGVKGADVVFVSEDGLGEGFRLGEEEFSHASQGALLLHVLPAKGDMIDEALLSDKAFCGLDQAVSLKFIEMSVLSLVVKG